MWNDLERAAVGDLPWDAACYAFSHRKDLNSKEFKQFMVKQTAKTAVRITTDHATQYVASKIFNKGTYGQRLGIRMAGKFTSSFASDMIFRNPLESSVQIAGKAVASSLREGAAILITEDGGKEWLEDMGFPEAGRVVGQVHQTYDSARRTFQSLLKGPAPTT